MKLNRYSIEKIKREQKKAIENLLKDVPDGVRISIDKDVLENLLFEYCDVYLGNANNIPEEYRDKTVTFKHLVWSGDFLSKIDLSKVSFDDVVWIGDKNNIFTSNELIKNYFRKVPFTYLDKICLKYTNAKIDFSKSAFTKYLGLPVYIAYCNFTGTDLSNNILTNFRIWHSNMNDTQIYVSNSICNNTNESENLFLFSSFENCDFTSFIVSPEFFGCSPEKVKQLKHGSYATNFKNTGMQINLPKPTRELSTFFRKYIKVSKSAENQSCGIRISRSCCLAQNKELEEIYTKHKNYIDGVINLINNKYKEMIYGCYINGKKILTPEENKKISETLLTEYKKLEQKKIDDVVNPIANKVRCLIKNGEKV